MKIISLILLTLGSLDIYCQTIIEAKAVDFYIDSLYQGERIMATGKVLLTNDRPMAGIEIDLDNDAIANTARIYYQFLVCKANYENRENKSGDYRNQIDSLSLNGYKGYVDTSNIDNLSIEVNKPLIKVKRKRFQQPKGGIIGFKRNLVDKVLGEPCFLEVYRTFRVSNYYYVLIIVIKKDYEYGQEYYIKLDENGNVIDWCKRGWA